jgi:hypothetical protein
MGETRINIGQTNLKECQDENILRPKDAFYILAGPDIKPRTVDESQAKANRT